MSMELNRHVDVILAHIVLSNKEVAPTITPEVVPQQLTVGKFVRVSGCLLRQVWMRI